MPGAARRTYPARTSSRWLGTSASAGSSRRVRRNSVDKRVITAGLLNARNIAVRCVIPMVVRATGPIAAEAATVSVVARDDVVGQLRRAQNRRPDTWRLPTVSKPARWYSRPAPVGDSE